MIKICANPLCKAEFETNRPQKKFCNPECRKKAEKAYLYLDESGSLPTILVDTREQNPFQFRTNDICAGSELGALPYGDYAIKGDLPLIVIERKQSIDELASNLFEDAERFERELEKMRHSKHRFVIVEASYDEIFSAFNKSKGRRRFSKIKSGKIFKRILSLELKYGVAFKFAGNRQIAQQLARGLLLTAVKNKHRGF